MGKFIFVAFLLIQALLETTSSSPASIPWQSKLAEESQTYEDLPPTIFAPQGRLYSVERVLKALSSKQDTSSNLAIALKCRDGIVVVTTIPPSPYLHHKKSIQKAPEPSSAPMQKNMTESDAKRSDDNYNKSSDENAKDGSNGIKTVEQTIDHHDHSNGSGSGTGIDAESEQHFPLWLDSCSFPLEGPIIALEPKRKVWAVTGGNAVDSQTLRRKIQLLAESWWQSNDDGSRRKHFDASVGRRDNHNQRSTVAALLARRLADHLQLPTQTVGGRSGRMLVSSALLIGHDYEIWRVDPSGQFWGCHAAAVGRASDQVQTNILKRVADALGDNDPKKKISPHHVQAYLRKLSTEEALALACECIQEVLEDDNYMKDATETTKSKLPQRLMGLSLQCPTSAILGQDRTHEHDPTAATVTAARVPKYRIYSENELLSYTKEQV